MQILAPKCGNTLFYSFPLIQSRNPLISSSFVAYFRSTPVSFEKWKDKWVNSSAFEDVKPSKTYIKYKTRQKRADAKKALNDIFFGSGSSKFTLVGDFLRKRRTKSWDEDPLEDKKKRDLSARCASKAHQKRKKNKSRKANFFEDFDDDDYDPRTHFQATFGNRRYSWSFKSWEESFSQSRTSGFEYSNTRNKWRTVSDDDESTEDDDSYVVGSHSDRIALGLPINGPLNIEEVKNAFRLSALKWHPDKHQGPSQALAEEKFKLCASAYKSLCNDLSRV
ncbi:hypothetical protein L1987_65504 [Smallanthus sonchifolius]|uniref:Uncharacterized protein n=1 Tax=Smallanthus sonchifolius TaxID=185202 RepID=A0ACB9BUR0_9ASTR|nr:hypothetical protein L1987_65504 [Smallanthus sonchifolius]